MSVKETRKTGPNVHFGVGAAMEAARDSGLEDIDPSRAGVIIGSAVGGLPQVLEQQKVLEERGRERVSPHWLPNMLVDTTTSHVATHAGAGAVANYAIVSACASGTNAIGDAAEVVKRGQADAILAGGTESAIVPLILAGFCSMRALADGRDDPAAGLAAVRRNPVGLRDGRGRGRGDGGGARARAAARREDLLRGGRLRRLERRLPRGHAAPRVGGRDRDDARGAGQLRHRAGGGRLHQRARHQHAVQRRGRDAGDQDRVRRRTPTRWRCRRSSR